MVKKKYIFLKNIFKNLITMNINIKKEGKLNNQNILKGGNNKSKK